MVDVGTIPARDRTNGVVAGVAAGIGRALEVDPTLVRLLALLALAGGAGIALYLAAALLMPDELGKRPGRVRFAAGMTLLLLAAVAAPQRSRASVVRSGLRGPRRGGSLLSLAEAATRARRRPGRTAAVVLFTAEATPAPAARSSRRRHSRGGLLLVVGPWLWRTAQGVLPSGRGESARRSARKSPPACTTRSSRRSRSSSASQQTQASSSFAPPGAGAALWLFPEGELFGTIRSWARSGTRRPRSRSCTAFASRSRRWERAARRRHARGRAGST